MGNSQNRPRFPRNSQEWLDKEKEAVASLVDHDDNSLLVEFVSERERRGPGPSDPGYDGLFLTNHYSLIHLSAALGALQSLSWCLRNHYHVDLPTHEPLDSHDPDVRSKGGCLYRHQFDPTDIDFPAGRLPSRSLYDHCQLTNDVRYRDHGLTPLALAIIFSPDDRVMSTVQLLLSSNANINAASCRCGWTPLMMAARRSHRDLLCLILESGGDMNMEDSYGYTALDLAMQKSADAINIYNQVVDERAYKRRIVIEHFMERRFYMPTVLIDIIIAYSSLSDDH